LVEPIGSGGMGEVFRAEHLTLGCDVAVKILRPSEAASEAEGATRSRRFQREARTAASLRGSHVVQVMDHGIDAGTPFIVMELLRGQSLRARLGRVQRLDPLELGRVLVHVVRALERAHSRGVVHRDLKPENVFLVADDAGEIAKVLDFGIAKVTSPLAAPSRVTESGAILGTPSYMSPEQLRGRNVGSAADLWSLAVMAFEGLCGRPPFEGESLADLIIHISTGPVPIPSSLAEVPDGFDEWFARGVRRDPNERFGSARELAEAYLALLPEVPPELERWPAKDEDLPAPPLPLDAREAPSLDAAAPPRATLSEPVTGEIAPSPTPGADAPIAVPARRSSGAKLAVTLAAGATLGLLLWAARGESRGPEAVGSSSGDAQADDVAVTAAPSAKAPAPSVARPAAAPVGSGAASTNARTSASAVRLPTWAVSAGARAPRVAPPPRAATGSAQRDPAAPSATSELQRELAF
jgi:eukaryotic-like serine/threonine-protein kinase